MERKDVEQIANLARLRLADDELERVRRQLGDILHYVSKLDELDVRGVEPTPYPIEIANAFREGRVAPALTRAEALSGAPKTEGLFFRVPKIIDAGGGGEGAAGASRPS
jgi:aspartyl-tRNA(Asn)/glutamyl-tRNA(Gln) amidotransferase subunit C